MCEVKKEIRLFACCDDFILFQSEKTQNEKIETRYGNSIDLTEIKNKNVLTFICNKEEFYYLKNTDTGILYGCKTNLKKVENEALSSLNDILEKSENENFQKLAPFIKKNYPGISYNNILKYFIALRLGYIDENFIIDNEQFVSMILSKALIGLCKNCDLAIIDYRNNKNKIVAKEVKSVIAENYNYNFYGIIVKFDKGVKVYDVHKNSYYEFSENDSGEFYNVKDGVLSSDGKYVVLLFDDGKARLYKRKMSDKGIFYEGMVCDLLKTLTKICDIAINNKDDVGLLYDKNKLKVLELNR